MGSREVKSGMCVLAAILVVGSVEYGRAQAPGAAAGQAAPAGGQGRGAAPAGQAAGRGAARGPVVTKQNLRMQLDELPTGGAVFGSGSEPGFYIVRNLFRAKQGDTPAGGSRPHCHDQDRYVTVIKGTWYTATGNFYDPDKMIGIKAGGVMFHPAWVTHYDGARDEDALVQIMGPGPARTIQAEVDAKGQPMGRGGRGADAAAPAAAPTGPTCQGAGLESSR